MLISAPNPGFCSCTISIGIPAARGRAAGGGQRGWLCRKGRPGQPKPGWSPGFSNSLLHCWGTVLPAFQFEGESKNKNKSNNNNKKA